MLRSQQRRKKKIGMSQGEKETQDKKRMLPEELETRVCLA